MENIVRWKIYFIYFNGSDILNIHLNWLWKKMPGVVSVSVTTFLNNKNKKVKLKQVEISHAKRK